MIEFTVGQEVRVNDASDDRHGKTFTITEVAESKWVSDQKYAIGAENTAGEFGVWFNYLEPVVKDADLIRINEVRSLKLFAINERLRTDWHEPDEQGISARIIGDYLDNAMGPTVEGNCGELNVVLTREGKDYAIVNLATLFSWAAR